MSETSHPVPDLHDALLFLAVAGLLIPLLRKLKINAVLGFLLAGVLLGPFGLSALLPDSPLVKVVTLQEVDAARALAELGVVMLLFLIGLELSWDRLWQMRRWIFGLGSAQLALCGTAIGGIAWAFGNSVDAAIILGGCLALSSTAIAMQLLKEQRTLGSPVGHASFSILLLQDLAVVPLLLLVGLLGQESDGGPWLPIATALGKATLAIVVIVAGGHWLVRPLFRWVAAQQQSESFMAITLLTAIGTAALTHALGLSLALGAFLAGVLLAETEFRHEIEVNLEPFNGLLMGLFFMAVGMNIDLGHAIREPGWLLASVLGLMLLKAALIAPLMRLQKLSWGAAVHGGLLLSQAGEFGFILIGMSMTLDILPYDTAQFMLLVVGSTMMMTPLVANWGARLQVQLDARSRASTDTPEHMLEQHVLIAGFGRVGQLVAQVLSDAQQPWVAIERSQAQVQRLRQQGCPVVFGDVSKPELLRKLHAERAIAVVVTVDEPEAGVIAVASIRQHFPHTPIYARAQHAEHAKRLMAAGATEVAPDAIESALQLAGHTLGGIGLSESSTQQALQRHRQASHAQFKHHAEQAKATH